MWCGCTSRPAFPLRAASCRPMFSFAGLTRPSLPKMSRKLPHSMAIISSADGISPPHHSLVRTTVESLILEQALASCSLFLHLLPVFSVLHFMPLGAFIPRWCICSRTTTLEFTTLQSINDFIVGTTGPL